MQTHNMPRQVDKKRERDARRKTGKRGREKTPRPQIGSICLVHKQSRVLRAARHSEGQNVAPTAQLLAEQGARKHAHIHMQTETDAQECSITRFIRLYTPAHINAETHIPIGTIIALT